MLTVLHTLLTCHMSLSTCNMSLLACRIINNLSHDFIGMSHKPGKAAGPWGVYKSDRGVCLCIPL